MASTASDINRELKTDPEGAATSSGEELAEVASLTTHPLSLQSRKELINQLSEDSDAFEKEENFATNLVRSPGINLVGAFNVNREGISRPGNNGEPLEDPTAFSAPSVEQEDSSNLIIEAVKVEEGSNDEEDVEERVRQKILEEAVTADVVAEPKDIPIEGRKSRRFCTVIVLLLIFIAVAAVAIGLSVSRDPDNVSMVEGANTLDEAGESSTETPSADSMTDLSKPGLETILDRGFIRCGVYDDMPGFSSVSSNGTWSGFNYRQVSLSTTSTNTMIILSLREHLTLSSSVRN
jgi:hypothetical protein